MLEAVLWDVDGTLAETERDGHLVAFNLAFADLGIAWRWSERRYGELLAVAGGRERLQHDMQFQAHAPAEPRERRELAERLHRLKNHHYARIVAQGGLPLRPGVAELLRDCSNQGFPMAIVTTTSRSNVDALLEVHLGRGWEKDFEAIVCAEDAPRKKPDPQAYEVALTRLGVNADNALAVEDAPAGIAAALGSGVPVIAVRSHYFPAADVTGTLAAGPSLGQVRGWHPAADAHATRIGLEQIIQWHAQGAFSRRRRQRR